MITSPCQQCGNPFDHRQRNARFCPDCRRAKHRALVASRDARAREARAEVQAVAESLRPYLMPDQYARVEEYIAALGVPVRDAPVVHDRQPDGTMSNGGSDDGVSTTDEALASDLEARRLAVIAHDWFTEHPAWQAGLYE